MVVVYSKLPRLHVLSEVCALCRLASLWGLNSALVPVSQVDAKALTRSLAKLESGVKRVACCSCFTSVKFQTVVLVGGCQ